ncbi:MAG TPA: PadR family transcriptional regulator [Euzebyales bacterium]
MLELAILGLLKERPMHGYELRKQLAQRLGLFWTVSFGSLYPTLKKLERRGVVEKVPTKSTDERPRRKQEYRITDAGEADFLELLGELDAQEVEEEKFSLRLAFFSYLSPEIRLRLLERRRSYLRERLDQADRALRRARRLRADTYTIALMRHGVNGITNDIAWLDELITAERVRVTEDRGEVDDSVEPSQAPEPPHDSTDVTESTSPFIRRQEPQA